MSDNRGIYQKISDGDYKTALPWVRRKEDPAAFTAYQCDVARLNQRFRADLVEHLGIRSHPKKDLLFEKAWDRGHSSGLGNVVAEAEDLVELIA